MELFVEHKAKYLHQLVILVLALMFLISGCSITNTVRKHPQYSTLASNLSTVYVLPPEVVITHKALSERDSRSSANEQHMLQIFAAQIPGYLTKQGISIPETKFEQAFGNAAELTLEQLRSAYRKASNLLHQEVVTNKSYKSFIKHENNEPIVSLGSVASYVSKQLAADGLLIVRYIGFEIATDGVSMERLDSAMSQKITKPFAKAATYGGVFEIALVDGQSGDVIWVNSNIQLAKPGQQQQNWETVTRDLLNKLKFDKPPVLTPVYARAEK